MGVIKLRQMPLPRQAPSLRSSSFTSRREIRAQLHAFSKSHGILPIKWVNFIVGALHLKRKLFKREKSVPSGEKIVEDYRAETFSLV